MDTENQTPEEQTSGDTYITYQVDMDSIESLLQGNQETLETISQNIDLIRQDQISGVGALGALIGFLIGFLIFKELLKVWLE